MKPIPTFLTLVSVLLSGCFVIAADFAKGRALLELPLARSSTFERTVNLPSGDADIVIAVRDAKRRPIDPHTTIDVTISGLGLFVRRSMKMGELTWAYAQGSCDAYGYIYDSVKGLSPEFKVAEGDYQLVVEVQSDAPKDNRVGALWIIYGDRAPTNRMFPAVSSN